jgi:hypothetical protein
MSKIACWMVLCMFAPHLAVAQVAQGNVEVLDDPKGEELSETDEEEKDVGPSAACKENWLFCKGELEFETGGAGSGGIGVEGEGSEALAVEQFPME